MLRQVHRGEMRKKEQLEVLIGHLEDEITQVKSLIEQEKEKEKEKEKEEM